jgi:hypothetical protein
MSQQDKTKKCNDAATQKALTGADRKSFMQTCLNAGSTPQSLQEGFERSLNARCRFSAARSMPSTAQRCALDVGSWPAGLQRVNISSEVSTAEIEVPITPEVQAAK